MKYYCIIALILILASCGEPQEVTRILFKVNKQINCSDLIDQGYQWMPGVDVILLGKRTGDTLDYYQLSYDRVEAISENLEFVEIETSEQMLLEPTTDEKEEQTPDFVSVNKTPEICDNATPDWRYFQITISANDTMKFINNINRDTYSVIQGESDYDLYNALVINKETRDTFNFAISEMDGSYYVSSSINLK